MRSIVRQASRGVDEAISTEKVDDISHGEYFTLMPATKPKTGTPDRSEYMAAYYLKRREDLRKIKHERYLENREEHIAAVQQSKAGMSNVEDDGTTPPVRRRWLVIGDRVYFNSRIGISQGEMRTVLDDLKRSIASQTEEEFTRNSIRQRKHLAYIKNRSGEIDRMRKYREKVEGSTPRKDSPVGTRITVTKRRWMVVGSRLYFNPKVELTLHDVQQAVRELRLSLTRSASS